MPAICFKARWWSLPCSHDSRSGELLSHWGFALIVGSMDIMAWFIPFLLFLGIATPPVAGIYIADFLLYRRGGYDAKVLATEPQVKVFTFIAWDGLPFRFFSFKRVCVDDFPSLILFWSLACVTRFLAGSCFSGWLFRGPEPGGG